MSDGNWFHAAGACFCVYIPLCYRPQSIEHIDYVVVALSSRNTLLQMYFVYVKISWFWRHRSGHTSHTWSHQLSPSFHSLRFSLTVSMCLKCFMLSSKVLMLSKHSLCREDLSDANVLRSSSSMRLVVIVAFNVSLKCLCLPLVKYVWAGGNHPCKWPWPVPWRRSFNTDYTNRLTSITHFEYLLTSYTLKAPANKQHLSNGDCLEDKRNNVYRV